MSDIAKVPLAFKHINLYEILEPERVHNVQTAKLIDINDDKLDSNPDLIGSFVDNVTKKEFDILDVFENIYVTPQHLQRQKKNDFDFDIFIKESKDELDETTYVESANGQTDREKEEPNKVCTLDEIFDKVVSNRSFPKLNRLKESDIEPKTVNEDLNDDQSKPAMKHETILPILSTLELKINKHVQENEGIDKNKLLNTYKFQSQLQNVQNPMADTSKAVNLPTLSIARNTNVTLPNTRLEENRFLLRIYQNQIKTALINENKVIEFNQNPPIPVLQTVKVDKKAFAKRIVKSESEKASFTKGPDLYEKSVVLPQIMHRLKQRNEIIQAKSNVRKKLILDCQSSISSLSATCMPTFAPEMLLEDCNKKRLQAIQVRQAFNKFVKYGKI